MSSPKTRADFAVSVIMAVGAVLLMGLGFVVGAWWGFVIAAPGVLALGGASVWWFREGRPR